MSTEITDDNLYKVGSIVYAKADPALQLIIVKYLKRIYYCGIVGHLDQSNLAYFERELTSTVGYTPEQQFTHIPEKLKTEKYNSFKP